MGIICNKEITFHLCLLEPKRNRIYYRATQQVWIIFQLLVMESKTLMFASVTGTITPKDGTESKVSCSYFLN